MANNSAKKNEQSIKSIKVYLQWAVFGFIGWMLLINTFYLLAETISIWHYLLCYAICAISFVCYKQVIKCWELQLPSQAAQYYYDILAMNAIVQLVDPVSHYVWHIYWLILVFIAYHAAKWLWDYITPKYEPVEEEGQEGEESGKRKEKKEKQKVKYVKR